MATWAVTPASPRATVDFARIALSDLEHTRGPDLTGGPFTYRIRATGPSDQVIASHEFSPSKDGEHAWDNVAFDEDGAWTLDLLDTDDDSVVDTEALTVAAAE